MALDQDKLARLYQAVPCTSPAPVADLAAAAALPAGEVRGAVEELRAAGAPVRGDEARGYYLELPPPLQKEAISRRVAGAVGRPLYLREAVVSTMGEARVLAASGAGHGTTIFAESQSRGRGRQGRVWASPPRLGLYVSIILGKARLPREVTLLPLLGGVAVAEAVASAGVAPRLKWPNDVLAGGAKLGGILAESYGAPGVLIIGVGVNVFQCPFDFPEGMPYEATSLHLAGAVEVDRNELAAAILNSLDAWLGRWREEGAAPVLSAWRARDVTLGRRLRLAGTVGQAVDVGEDGALIVEDDAGDRRAVYSADVFPLD